MNYQTLYVVISHSQRTLSMFIIPDRLSIDLEEISSD